MQHLLAWLDQTFDPHNDPPEVAKDIELLRWMASGGTAYHVVPPQPGKKLSFALVDVPSASAVALGPLEALREAVERSKGLRK